MLYKTLLSVSASPIDFAGLVPAAVLSVWSIVSVPALEVNKREEEEKREGVWLKWMSNIVFLCLCLTII